MLASYSIRAKITAVVALLLVAMTGMGLLALSGTGWTCALPTMSCSNPTQLLVGQSYADITATMYVTPTAPATGFPARWLVRRS